MCGTEACDRAEAERDHRHKPQIVGHVLVAHRGAAEAARQIGAARGLDGLYRTTTARALDDADDGQAQLVGHALGNDGFFRDGGIGRAAAHGEVVARDDDRTSVDRRATGNPVRRREALQLVLLVVAGHAGNGADLAQRAWIDQFSDPLTDGEPAAIVLAAHLVGAAHYPCVALALSQLVKLRLPALVAAVGAIVLGHFLVSPAPRVVLICIRMLTVLKPLRESQTQKTNGHPHEAPEAMALVGKGPGDCRLIAGWKRRGRRAARASYHAPPPTSVNGPRWLAQPKS